MRRLVTRDGVTATMDDRGHWTSDLESFAETLNWFTKQELPEIGPSKGNPLAVVFRRVVDLVRPVKVIDTTPIPDTSEEVVY